MPWLRASAVVSARLASIQTSRRRFQRWRQRDELLHGVGLGIVGIRKKRNASSDRCLMSSRDGKASVDLATQRHPVLVFRSPWVEAPHGCGCDDAKVRGKPLAPFPLPLPLPFDSVLLSVRRRAFWRSVRWCSILLKAVESSTSHRGAMSAPDPGAVSPCIRREPDVSPVRFS